MFDFLPALIRATGIQPGELVLVHFWGEDADKPIANGILTAVAALGASPLLLMQSRQVNQALFASAADASFDARYFLLFQPFTTVLDVFAQPPIVLGAALPEAQMALYRRYIATLFGALVKIPRFVQLRLPTAANAADSGLSPDDFIRRMERAYAVDYAALRAACQAKARELATHPLLTLRTGEEHALSFDFTGRTWHIDAGDGDLPCGEVYAAPLEHATCGAIHFPRLHLPDLGDFADVTLHIQDGQAVSASHPAVDAHLRSLPPAQRVVCELGFGLNPGVTDLCGCTVLDEKATGAFHIALGANTLFGGANDAPSHTDLVSASPFTLQFTA